MGIGDVIKAYRLARGFSQTGLARRAGVPQGTLSRIEGGHQVPSTGTLGRLAAALGAPVDELLQAAEQGQPLPLEQLRPPTVVSPFIQELQTLERQLTPGQQAVVLRIARALTTEVIRRKDADD